ncbi:hypothetical protein AMTRI_Chr08g164680 [Amborella trichopoda]|uniref:Uncharacterized protein n=1 Tax=Amborella trichopoda TaxID=13333 RepID=W1P4Z8_AMBTC|nr:hypothetical protein AMTR_s00080p00161580 [Amborella trichopoda]
MCHLPPHLMLPRKVPSLARQLAVPPAPKGSFLGSPASCTRCPEILKEPCQTVGRSGNFKRFNYPPGLTNGLASLFLNTNTNDGAISSTLHYPHKPQIFCFHLLTYGVALPSGLFIPGASYGCLVGRAIASSLPDLDPRLFALLGAASFLGGTMCMTVFCLCNPSGAYKQPQHAPPFDAPSSNLENRGRCF